MLRTRCQRTRAIVRNNAQPLLLSETQSTKSCVRGDGARVGTIRAQEEPFICRARCVSLKEKKYLRTMESVPKILTITAQGGRFSSLADS